MKNENTVTVFKLDIENPPRTDWSRFDAMTDEERHSAALSGADS